MKLPTLTIAPARLLRGELILETLAAEIGVHKILAISGIQAQRAIAPRLAPLCWDIHWADPLSQCSEAVLDRLQATQSDLNPTLIMAIGGGKVLDAAKILADRTHLPIVTIPSSAATCAAWTALGNIYSAEGSFSYDVPLSHCPEWMVVDYTLIATAPQRTLVSGIGDALAKWYEASVSSGHSEHTMVIGAVQSARVLRDMLFQQGKAALEHPGSAVWREVVDATVCLAGVIGGLGGAQCRTVAAHAIHNGLTHLPQCHGMLHGEKVAYGILVQLRLEEFQGNQLAASARQQLLKFYQEIGLPRHLGDLGLGDVSLRDLEQVASVACDPHSDMHHLPFAVSIEQVVAAMVSTTAPLMGAPLTK